MHKVIHGSNAYEYSLRQVILAVVQRDSFTVVM